MLQKHHSNRKGQNTACGLSGSTLCAVKMPRVLTVAEKLLVGGWPFKEEDLDLSVWRRERQKERDVHEKFIRLRK